MPHNRYVKDTYHRTLLPSFTTQRLLLRPFTLDDAPRVTELADDPHVSATTLSLSHPYTLGMAEQWIQTHPKEYQEHEVIVLALILLNTDELIGTIGLQKTSNLHHADVGYWIGAMYWGNGYCTEALVALIQYGFNHMDYHKISGEYFSSNPASGRVMQKAGMLLQKESQTTVRKNDTDYMVKKYNITRPKHITP